MGNFREVFSDEPGRHAGPHCYFVETHKTLRFRLGAAVNLTGCTGARIMSGYLVEAHGAAIGMACHFTPLYEEPFWFRLTPG